MKAEERVTALHEKMDAMRRRKEIRKTRIIGAANASLAACLVFLIFGGGTAHFGGTAGMYSGATMLFENAGGYVLLAVGAFMAGVIATVLIKRSQKMRKELSEEGQRSAEAGEKDGS
ncbi:MAG: hypothetical protein IJM17_03730 [Firmicutes bacterium]|nr:hypothetical protein [Bacillota bacterium]